MTIQINGTSGITFPDATIQTTAAVALGVGQTWQSVTRVPGTLYTNNTGKPIMCVVWGVSNSLNESIQWTVGGVSFIPVSGMGSSATNPMASSAIIPVGATYSFIQTTGTFTVTAAVELR